ncbi:hypothetical protein GW17_00012328 [Ensete ventricosum]|nr:hypothetical protein GW17_00012328 [Ensete ventricosum]RZS17751.1 hypothetical protein BHM03_00049938 [Ensete ventricosum]
MGEVEYPSSLTYPAKELCISSVTLQRKLMEDNVVKSSPLVISITESRLSASFLN